MPAFRYKHGERPLEGFTIQRGVGRGGFGEVYYAISDSGREVALKFIQGYEQIELRGVSQCMNLKNPHLVTIFDVRHSAEGAPFVIMEYCSGPSLRQLLDESPAGLSTQKAAFFVREIAKGLAYLHDCGIVHRDLKPANIFYENGTVKICDYGLSKAITQSQHSAQTITVGTVHYMAPEIGMGRYDRGVDIYALGAVLYEMLTGQVPYIGASAAEVLMKHLSNEPDVSGIEEPFASVIRKCMARDPKARYQTVQEVVEALFGADHVRNSVSVFRPESLSMVAQRVAQRVGAGGGSATPTPPLPPPPPVDSWNAGQAPIVPPNRINAFVPRSEPCRPFENVAPHILARYIWIGIICLSIPLFAGFVALANDRSLTNAEEGAAIAVCIGLAVLTLFAGVQLLTHWGKKTFKGWWREMYRPLALWGCLQAFITAACYLGNAGYSDAERVKGGELVIVWFFILFPIMLIPVILTLRVGLPQAPVRPPLANSDAASQDQTQLHVVKGKD
jgi:serine/threonine protein kinase